MRKEMDGNVFISRRSRHFEVDVFLMKVIFPFCNLTWLVNNFVSRQGKVYTGETKVPRDRTVVIVLAFLSGKFIFSATLT